MRRTVLPGGLRVVTEYIPSVHSASVGVWVDVGSRDEGASVAGAAHFLEHLLFKSTPTRTAVDIAQAVDAVGGELNAFTAREHTCYYAHVLDTDLELAVDLVADVVLRGRCAADDVEIERDVVLEEIAMRDDDPEDTLGDVFLSAMFGTHPVGRPVIGSADSIAAMTRATTAFVPHASLYAGADGGCRRGKRRPRRGRGVGARTLRPAAGSWPKVVAAAQGHRPGAGATERCSWSKGTQSRPICRWASGHRVDTGSIGGRCRCSTPRWVAA